MLALEIDSRGKGEGETRGVKPRRQFGKNGRGCDLSFVNRVENMEACGSKILERGRFYS
jgi:hypothetical protein